MSVKSVPLSARISDADSEFLARLSVAGATTPSEKVRALIAEARRRHEGRQDYAGCLALMEEMFAPALRRLRRLEHEANTQSGALKALYAWLPEVAALLITGVPEEAGDGEALRDLEARAADQVFALLDAWLRHGLTTRIQCYDQSLISARIEPVLELVKLIDEKHQPR